MCDWQEMQREVSAALAQRDPNLVLSSAFKLHITQRDLATLQEGAWLNDEVDNTPDLSLQHTLQPLESIHTSIRIPP